MLLVHLSFGFVKNNTLKTYLNRQVALILLGLVPIGALRLQLYFSQNKS